MGLTFKPNIDNLRESPAKYIVQQVLQNLNGGDCFIVEPNIESHSVFKLAEFDYPIKNADIIAFLVAHMQFKNLGIFNKK